ncbi:MAG TPA: PAS domain-containing protein, partial [Rhodoblastus sp.]|nr:PAS domain-containing protein [Rhodoblastus sp.]
MSQTTSPSSVDRTERAGSPGLVLLLAGALVAVMAGFSFLQNEQATRLTLGLLAFLAFIGISALLAYAVGFLQFAGAQARNDVTKLIADTSPDGMVATEGESRIIYANETYLALCGANDAAGLRTVDRLFSGAPEVAEPLYRLAQAAREGKRAAEELRLTPPLLGEGEFGWYRIRVRPIERPSGPPAALWTISDVTRERERHENIFQELQHAIDFLDHAPAGFFSTDPNGNISYMNATLAGWLDF